MDWSGQVLIELTRKNFPNSSVPAARIGDLVSIPLYRNAFFGPGLNYKSKDCLGSIWVDFDSRPNVVPFLRPGRSPKSGKLTGYLPDPAANPAEVVVESFWGFTQNSGLKCINQSVTLHSVVPAIPTVDLSIYKSPFKLVRVQ